MRLLLIPSLLLSLSLAAQTPTTTAKPAPTQLKPATAKPAAASKAEHGPINWVSLEQAMELAKRDGKPIMIDVYTTWCGPCKMLASKTFTDKQLADYVNSHYHAVKFDAEGAGEVTFKGKTYKNPSYNPAMQGMRNGTHDLTMQIAPVNGRVAYPTVVYMDAEGNVLAPVQGYLTPDQMEPILIYFGESIHKTQDYNTWYPTFKTRRTAP